MSDNERIFLGLGSNIENRYKNLILGINLLNEHPHIWVINKSYIYQTPPMYFEKQNDFFNMVIEIETNLNPLELLHNVKEIENNIGRNIQDKKNMPRKLDIDILAIGNLIINTKILNVPHSGISERIFVLKPWNDIAPNFLLPNNKNNISSLLNDLNVNTDIHMVLITDNKDSS